MGLFVFSQAVTGGPFCFALHSIAPASCLKVASTDSEKENTQILAARMPQQCKEEVAEENHEDSKGVGGYSFLGAWPGN